MHKIFDESWDPVNLNKLTFNSLSSADGLVLVGKSPKGFQSCLNKLENYCEKMELKTNYK